MKKLLYLFIFSFGLTCIMQAAQIQVTQQHEVSDPEQRAFESMMSVLRDSSLSEETRYKKVAALVQQHPQLVTAHTADGDTALILTAWTGRTEIVKLLIAAGADLNAHNVYGWTALILAVRKDRTEITKLLLAAGADLNAQNNAQNTHRYTALMHAAYNDHAESVKLLIAAGADSNAYDTEGDTALMHAARKDHSKMTKLLIAAGADPNIQNDKDGNKIARDYACDKDAYDTAVQAGLDIKAQYEKAQAAARNIIAQEVTHVTPLVDMISDYAYDPQNPDDLPEIQEEIKEKSEDSSVKTVASSKKRWCVVQ